MVSLVSRAERPFEVVLEHTGPAGADLRISRVNAERLHAIVNELKAELGDTEAPSLMQQLVQGLQAMAQQPGQSGPEEQVSQVRRQLTENLSAAVSNGYSPAWRQAAKELGVADLLGNALLETVEEIFARNEITP